MKKKYIAPTSQNKHILCQKMMALSANGSENADSHPEDPEGDNLVNDYVWDDLEW
ncbi:MAG: hypothetical protein MJZ60_05295 [Bacteroidaceae bacterium]|nr:hypothetical protein [Bacteroidaceae bacterium]